MYFFSESEEEQFDPRGSSSRVSKNSTRNSNRSPERRSNRNAASTSRQQQPSQSTRGNQAGTSRETTVQQPVKGAAKRKTKKPAVTVKSAFRNGLQQIRFLQAHVENLIPKAPFCRCVKETLQRRGDFRMTREALEALQDATETYLVGIFDDGFRLTLHRNRVTIHPIDIQLLLYLRGVDDPGVP